MSTKFEALAAKVHSRRLAGWITNYNPKVKARAMTTRRRKKAEKAEKAAAKSAD